MKTLQAFGFLLFLMIPVSQNAQPEKGKTVPLDEQFQRLPFGSIKPAGWLKIQMQQDLDGFVGNLDRLVPDLIGDPIYGEGRLHKNSPMKDLGNLKSGDAEGDDQYKWWNSETQSNWWDAYIRNVLLLDDSLGRAKVDAYIGQILATQDEDGYLGIYSPELRYRFTAENGELWAKTTLYRGLLAYYESTGDPKVWTSLVRAVDNLMANYPINQSEPFFAGSGFTGGVSHGLNITDIFDRMYQLTGKKRYRDYALFLYLNFSKNHASEADAQLANILRPEYALQSHGAHTYEHLRPLTVAAYADGSPELQKALEIYLTRIQRATTLAGGPVGDEWIGGRAADATEVGYEYCSLHELLDSYSVLMQKSGKAEYGDRIENIFYNAAQGARDPNHSCIAYLKTDNSYEMMGTKNGETEPGRNQTRYKYSPVHQDVAVCCAPNAGRISPYFLQSAWMKQGEHTLVAALLVPNELNITLGKDPISIRTDTEYPFKEVFQFQISLKKARPFTLKIRKPEWVKGVETSEKYQEEDGYLVIEREFQPKDSVRIRFLTEARVEISPKNEHYFFYGVQAYAYPLSATEQVGRTYQPGFEDIYYSPNLNLRFRYPEKGKLFFDGKNINVELENTTSGEVSTVPLVPMGRTVLRQVGF